MTGDIPDVSGALCRAIEALQDRQVLLRYAIDELTSARRSAVVRCFIDALTRGGKLNIDSIFKNVSFFLSLNFSCVCYAFNFLYLFNFFLLVNMFIVQYCVS